MMWFDLEKKAEPHFSTWLSPNEARHRPSPHTEQTLMSSPLPPPNNTQESATTFWCNQPWVPPALAPKKPTRQQQKATCLSLPRRHPSTCHPLCPFQHPSSHRKKGAAVFRQCQQGFPPFHPALRLLLRRGHVGRVWCGGPPCMVPRQQRRHINCPTDCVCRISGVDQAYFLLCKQKKHHTELTLPPFVNLDAHQTSPPIPPYKQTNSPSSQRNHHGTQPPRKQAPSTSLHSRPRPIIPINYLPKQHKPSQHKHREKKSPTCVAGTPFAAARNRSSTGIVPAAHARV